jgi:hypothetical protein
MCSSSSHNLPRWLHQLTLIPFEPAIVLFHLQWMETFFSTMDGVIARKFGFDTTIGPMCFLAGSHEKHHAGVLLQEATSSMLCCPLL